MFGGNVKTWGTLRSATIALAVIASAGLVAAPAAAATDQEVASWITASTLEKLDVTTPDAELAAALDAAIAEALAAGIIAPQVEQLAEDAVGDPESELDAEIDEALDNELEEQTRGWDEVSAQWHETFDAIHAEFAECREAAEGGADLCAHQFRYDMRVNHVQAWQARHAAKLGDVSALPAEEQEAALAKLERQGAHAAAQLERARTQLEKKTGMPVEEEQPDETSAPVEEAPAAESTGQNAPETDQRGNKAQKTDHRGNGNGNGNGNNGNKGGNGHGNGKSDR